MIAPEYIYLYKKLSTLTPPASLALMASLIGPTLCMIQVCKQCFCERSSSEKVWQPEIVLEGRRGRQEPRPSLQKGGWQPRQWLCSLCEKVREGQEEGKQSRPRTLVRAGYYPSANNPFPCTGLPLRQEGGVEVDMEVAEGVVDEYWMRAIWDGAALASSQTTPV